MLGNVWNDPVGDSSHPASPVGNAFRQAESDVVVVPVAVNVTETPGAASRLARKLFIPVIGPRVQLPTRASPDASVSCVPPVTEPPPEITAKATVTPETGLP